MACVRATLTIRGPFEALAWADEGDIIFQFLFSLTRMTKFLFPSNLVEVAGGKEAFEGVVKRFYELSFEDPILGCLYEDKTEPHHLRFAAWFYSACGVDDSYRRMGGTRHVNKMHKRSQHCPLRGEAPKEAGYVGDGFTVQQRNRWLRLQLQACEEFNLPKEEFVKPYIKGLSKFMVVYGPFTEARADEVDNVAANVELYGVRVKHEPEQELALMAWCLLSAFSTRGLWCLLIIIYSVDIAVTTHLKSNNLLPARTLVCLCISRVILTPLAFLAAYSVWKRRVDKLRRFEDDQLLLPLTGSEDLSIERDRLRAIAAEKRQTGKIVNAVQAAAFVVQTISAVMTGVEAVQLERFESPIDVVLLCSIIFWSNIEYFLGKDIFDGECSDPGELLVGIHLHPVFFMTEMKCHSCDVCMERIEDDGYRCKTCDFDVCLRCHARHRRERPPAAAAVDTTSSGGFSLGQFFCRSIHLALEFWPTLLAAMLCMLACQATVLAAPNLQGKIFDSIIRWDRQLFTRTVYVYLCVNLVQGLLAAVQSLTLNLVARRIRATVWRKLYTSVIGQDISFFDATHTGNLTSRLTNDAAAMTNPCRTILNNLVANALLLLGGAIMCFATNWRLGVLAATSMIPISYAYRLYAHWSRQVYSTIYQAMGDANSVATESFSNIRTVRAFGAEKTEIANYNEAVEVGLQAGVRSAVVGAGVYGYAKYIDLGTTVLILWYGGSAIFNRNDVTLGTLVAFQLYWNMMNGAFNALSDVVNDLIRAASAAERVFNLMDKRPGIDPNEGQEVDDIVGDIKIDNLSFCYSSRPDKTVLESVDLEMRPSTVTALVGKSGGGKSTLVHLLLRFYDPTEGRILMDGIDYRQYKPASLR